MMFGHSPASTCWHGVIVSTLQAQQLVIKTWHSAGGTRNKRIQGKNPGVVLVMEGKPCMVSSLLGKRRGS